MDSDSIILKMKLTNANYDGNFTLSGEGKTINVYGEFIATDFTNFPANHYLDEETNVCISSAPKFSASTFMVSSLNTDKFGNIDVCLSTSKEVDESAEGKSISSQVQISLGCGFPIPLFLKKLRSLVDISITK